ncbi:uncharacterized protein LTR77_002991 [Saxophila tyrrhenica]|uniref:CENP-V/GFA domain-containing protein n=1 Tax=Saxophila tyrrhenica TaxID=1690608 RepID=A0AAV9PGP8_9PEZI|nr:hypothetical protein LTR77_002991 [Saxophila tyrrhenica]
MDIGVLLPQLPAENWIGTVYCSNLAERFKHDCVTNLGQCQGFVITEGEDYLSTYVDSMTDSGQPLQRQFCKNCGSNLFNHTPLNDDIVSVSAGALDEFEDWKPSLEQYCIHRADFLEKTKSVEARYIESIKGDLERESDSTRPATEEFVQQ